MNTLNTSTPVTVHPAVRACRGAALALLLGGAAFGAMAQYKIVSPDGHVTYTDKPPVGTAPTLGSGNGSSGSSGSLPAGTTQASAKYPVTLYAAKSCVPCDSARQWLRNRGVPFNEFSIDNDRSLAAFAQRFGGTTMPIVTIGGQTINGFSSSDLQSYIDAAGYPAAARLSGYSWPAAVPLVPAAATAPAPVAATGAAPSAAAMPPPSKNGIQF